jgi:hypothetical protein
MNLAAILGIYLLSLVSLTTTGLPPASALPGSSTQQNQSTDTATTPQATSTQNPEASQTPSSPNSQISESPAQAKPSPKRHRQPKKPAPPDCSNSPAQPPAVTANSSDSTSAAASTPANPESSNAAPALKPCPPPKKIVRNGGSSQPAIQLTGGTTAEQEVHQRSTVQLTAATEENLKQIEGRDLTSSQQELKNQIKQFMAQSKTAVAAGDLERGHDLALKAHLLSDELLKP